MASSSASRSLTDHAEIRRWAEERSARPAAVRAIESNDDVGILRLDFPEHSGKLSVNEISWDDWFRKFDENDLVLVVQDQLADGRRSNFNKLVSRGNIDEGDRRENPAQEGSARESRSRQTEAGKSNRSAPASPKSSRPEKSA
jgi:hypothetical protein